MESKTPEIIFFTSISGDFDVFRESLWQILCSNQMGLTQKGVDLPEMQLSIMQDKSALEL